MGTISARKRANGTTGYTAQIRLTKDGKVVHTESQTFDRKPAARAWLIKREDELAKPGALGRARKPDITLGQAIDRAISDSRRVMGKTKAQVLRTIKTLPIAEMPCSEIDSADIVAMAQDLLKEREPQTVGNYLSHLSAIFAIARPAWNVELDATAMKDAQIVLRRLGVIGKSRMRDRRPTMDELDRLLAHFADRRQRSNMLPMVKVIGFALFSTRRLEEITRIARKDFDRDGSRILVRDMKHPGEKQGNDIWCDLPPEAVAILDAAPSDGNLFFPYHPDTISANFTRACKVLGIEDLHFHDLRHEGVSRLFEMGRTIPLAATVSGHRSWVSLRRYTHIRATGDRYQGWKWLRIMSDGRIDNAKVAN